MQLPAAFEVVKTDLPRVDLILELQVARSGTHPNGPSAGNGRGDKAPQELSVVFSGAQLPLRELSNLVRQTVNPTTLPF